MRHVAVQLSSEIVVPHRRRSTIPSHSIPARADALIGATLKTPGGVRMGPLQLMAAAVIVLVSLLPMPLPLLALGGIIVLVLTPLAAWITLLFFGVVMAFSGVLDYWPVPAGPMKLYAIDFIAIVFLWTALYSTFQARIDDETPPLTDPGERRLVTLFAIWGVLGVFFLAYGLLVHGYPLDRAGGDFRRQVWYAAAFFVPIFFPFRQRHLSALKYVIVMSGVITIAIGMYRIGTGNAARFDENWETGSLAVRWLWIVECMTLSTMLAYLVLVLRAGTGVTRKAVAVALCFPTGVLLILSGWRLAMIYTVAAPTAALVLWSWARRDSLRKVAMGGITAGLAAVPAFLLVPILLPDLFSRMMLDLRMRLINDVVQGGFRTWATSASLSEFASSPLIGKGFGFYLTVATRNQSGFFDYVEMNNAHNIFLTALHQTGILGFVPFVLFHGLFVVVAVRSLRRLPAALLPTYIALVVGYICYMGYANTQPFVSSQFIIMYVLMGFVVRLARDGSAPDLRPAKS